jgi:hypothetical protein
MFAIRPIIQFGENMLKEASSKVFTVKLMLMNFMLLHLRLGTVAMSSTTLTTTMRGEIRITRKTMKSEKTEAATELRSTCK